MPATPTLQCRTRAEHNACPQFLVGGGGNQGESSSGGANGEGTEVHWKKAPTRSRNRGAVEDFQGAKVTFGGSDSDDSSVSE